MAGEKRLSPPASSGSGLAVVAAAFAAQCAAAFGFLAVGLLAPSLALVTGLDERDFAFSATFVFFGVAIASPSATILMRRLGSVWTLAGMLFGMSAAMLLTLLGSWTATMAACFLFGLCYGPYGPALSTVVASRSPYHRRGLYLAIRQSGVPFAGAIAGRLLPPLILAFGWWTGVFAISGFLAAGAVFTLAVASLFRVAAEEIPATPIQDPPSGGPGFGRWLTRTYALPPSLRLLGIAAIGFAISHTALTAFAYFYLLEGLHYSPIAAGIYLSNSLLTAAVGRPLLGWIVDLTGSPMKVLAGIALVAAIAYGSLLAISSTTPLWVVSLVAVAAGASASTWTSIFMTAVADEAPEGEMTAYSGRAFSYAALGWMVAPPLLWAGIELSGTYLVPFAILLGTNLLTCGVLLAAERRRAQ
jgi:MFS family permease